MRFLLLNNQVSSIDGLDLFGPTHVAFLLAKAEGMLLLSLSLLGLLSEIDYFFDWRMNRVHERQGGSHTRRVLNASQLGSGGSRLFQLHLKLTADVFSRNSATLLEHIRSECLLDHTSCLCHNDVNHEIVIVHLVAD